MIHVLSTLQQIYLCIYNVRWYKPAQMVEKMAITKYSAIFQLDECELKVNVYYTCSNILNLPGCSTYP